MGYYCMHLHMHSCCEGSASMEGHIYEASQMGMKHIWFTDHDIRMGKQKNAVNGFNFEDKLIISEDASEMEERVLKKLEQLRLQGVILEGGRLEEHLPVFRNIVSHGWRQIEFENQAISDIKVTDENAYTGKQCMKLSVHSKKNEWQSAGVTFFSGGHRHVYSLLSQVSLKIAYMTKKFPENDARIIFDIILSQRPPEHNFAHLKYVIGSIEGLEEKHVAVIPLPQSENGWSQLEFNLSEDAQKYPVGGLDNVFLNISVILEVKNGAELSCYIDDFEIISLLKYEKVHEMQKQAAAQAGKKYGVTPFVGTEISAAGQHKNSFCTNVPIIDYEKNNYKVSHKEAIEWVKKHGGIFSLNHPFESWKNIKINDSEREMIFDKISSQYILSKCDGASLIEIGFPEGRSNFPLKYYLRLWDKLSENAVFITGYGDSDNHANDRLWRNGNNFAAWIHADNPTEENFIKSMKSGNLFTGDPVIFKGNISFKTGEGYTMGQVIKADKAEYSVIFEASHVASGWTVSWILDGLENKKTEIKAENFKESLRINVKKLHFVRVEVYDSNGRCILLTNPIYFVKDNSIVIPKERMADFGGEDGQNNVF